MQNRARYRVIGMDCAADAAEIEQAARAVAGVDTAKVSTASQIMTVHVADHRASLPEVERAVTVLGYRLDRLGESQGPRDDDELPADPRISGAAPYGRKLFVHQFRLADKSELDEAFAAWLREAYEVGCGAHLGP